MTTVPIYEPNGFAAPASLDAVIFGDRIVISMGGHDHLVSVNQVAIDEDGDRVAEIGWRSREADPDGIPCMSGVIRRLGEGDLMVRLASRPSPDELAAEVEAGWLS